MTPDASADLILTLLFLVLPVAALMARRVPIGRIAAMLALWAGIFAIGLVLYGQRTRIEPYWAQAARLLQLDSQEVVGNEVRIRMGADGHFWATVRIGDVRRRMLIDSGATVTALSRDTIDALGIEANRSAMPVLLRTANGTVQADTAIVPELHVGDVVARRLQVVVSPAFGDTEVLGMNFLSRLKAWRVEDNVLILTPHHPQDFT